MKTVNIISTANAGMLIELDGKKILIDAFHNEQYAFYPTVTSELFRQITQDPAFSKPDYLIYTHCHPDHFSAELTEECARLWPDMLTILPEEKADGLVLTDAEEKFRFGELEFSFARLPHESVTYADVPHYGVLIRCGGLTILDPGDCEIASEKLMDFIYRERVDIAILNFPWLALRRGRQFVKDIIRPKHIVICHLPDPNLDTFKYEQNLENVVRREFADRDVRILKHPLQNITIEQEENIWNR